MKERNPHCRASFEQRLSWILSPTFLICLILTVINDFYLKSEYPGLITGKISDFTGLFIFPITLWVIIGRNKSLIFIGSALAFVFWKSPFSQPFIDLWNNAPFFNIGRVVDYTDLIALVSIWFAHRHKPSMEWSKLMAKPIKYSMLFVALIVIVACEASIEFQNKPKGVIPYSLAGSYQIEQIQSKDSVVYDTTYIDRIEKDLFLFQNSDGDTLFLGHVRKWKNNYITSLETKSGRWYLQAFRVTSDSVTNFPRGNWWNYAVDKGDISLEDNFQYIIEDVSLDRQDTVYYVGNTKRETHEVFSNYLNEFKSYRYKKLEIKEPEIKSKKDDLVETVRLNSTNESYNEVEIFTYPNPVSEQLHVEIKGAQKGQLSAEIVIYDERMVALKELQIDADKTEIDIQELPSGKYFVKIKNKNQNAIFKRIVKI